MLKHILRFYDNNPILHNQYQNLNQQIKIITHYNLIYFSNAYIFFFIIFSSINFPNLTKSSSFYKAIANSLISFCKTLFIHVTFSVKSTSFITIYIKILIKIINIFISCIIFNKFSIIFNNFQLTI